VIELWVEMEDDRGRDSRTDNRSEQMPRSTKTKPGPLSIVIGLVTPIVAAVSQLLAHRLIRWGE
jgi:hypothetical protein